MNSILLQPEDSKRVTDALLEKIKEADFDLASEVGFAMSHNVKGDLQAVFANWLDEKCDIRANLEYVLEMYLRNYGLEVKSPVYDED